VSGKPGGKGGWEIDEFIFATGDREKVGPPRAFLVENYIYFSVSCILFPAGQEMRYVVSFAIIINYDEAGGRCRQAK
jgi:hypothetical protein